MPRARRQNAHTGIGLEGTMYSDVVYSFIIGFIGAILFLLVDKYEPNRLMARLL